MTAALGALVARGALAVGALLPLRVLLALGTAAGWLWYRVVPIRRRLVRAQVGAALGLAPAEAEPVVRGMYLHLGRSVAELVALPRIFARARVDGRAHLDAALALGRGVVLVSAHLGNWELLVRAAAAAERPVHVLTKRLHRPWAQGAWQALRVGGAGLLPERGSARAVRAALGRGEIVAFVLDQHDPARSAVILPFFGQLAATSSGPARVARAAGAPLLPVFTWRDEEGRHHIRFEPPVTPAEGTRDEAVRETTRRLQARVEAAIRAHPEQWLWLHRRWKV